MLPGCLLNLMALWHASIHTMLATHPYPAVERFINVGSEEYPFHPHGQNGLVIGRDGYPLEGPGGQDLSFEKFAVNIGPGQTWDVLFKWYDAESYSPVKSGSSHRSRPGKRDHRHVLQWQSIFGSDANHAAWHQHAQPVRRVLHHLAQPCPLPAGCLWSDHVWSHHLPED